MPDDEFATAAPPVQTLMGAEVLTDQWIVTPPWLIEQV